MSDTLFYIIFGLIIIGLIVAAIVIAVTSNNDTTTVTRTKSLFKQCRNNFDCDMGYFCELRNHPSVGMCVIPPGGACHKDKNEVCYSGYVCDHQDGSCVKA